METLNLIQVRRSAGRRWVVALGAALSVSITGCGSLPRTPGGFSPLQADITSTTGDVAIEIDGPSGKGTGAASGAAKGTGIGLLVGLLASASCGPLAGLCAGVVLPTTTTIGAVSGAAVGAVRADSAADVERKKRLLATELAASPYSNLLAEQLRQRVRERHDIALPDETPAAATPIAQASDTSGRATQWQIEVLLTQVTQLRGTRDKALLLRVEGRLR